MEVEYKCVCDLAMDKIFKIEYAFNLWMIIFNCVDRYLIFKQMENDREEKRKNHHQRVSKWSFLVRNDTIWSEICADDDSRRLNKLKYRHFYCFDVNRVKSFMIYKKASQSRSVWCVCVCDSVWTVFSRKLLNWNENK